MGSGGVPSGPRPCIIKRTATDKQAQAVIDYACNPIHGRGLHSSTFRLNLSAFCGIGVRLGVVQGMLRRCNGVLGGLSGVF